jgi:hypothetical protein
MEIKMEPDRIAVKIRWEPDRIAVKIRWEPDRAGAPALESSSRSC